ncbi:MAG: DNA adenine methylase [Myxococcota bacterium]
MQKTKAQPFLKWAGGKRRLLNHILPMLPRHIDTYFEPFLGGGAVFFELAQQRRFRRAVLGDINAALISTYRVVRDDVDALIRALEDHAPFATSRDYIYAMRDLNPEGLHPISKAARFLFLNKTCFNGLYRVNKAAHFNVAFGRYKDPKVVDADGLRRAAEALQDVTLITADFEETSKDAGPGDGVYLDPPYVPASATASFTAYTSKSFGPGDHQRLLAAYRAGGDRGATVVLSNADISQTRKLYAGQVIKSVRATRTINAVAGKRGPVGELLVTHPRPDDALEAQHV